MTYSFVDKFKQLLKFFYSSILEISDSIGEYYFIKHVRHFNLNIIEIGCHYPRLQNLTKANYLAGFEANPLNISQNFSDSETLKVFNLAITEFKSTKSYIDFYLPCTSSSEYVPFSTGKGSLLPMRHNARDVNIKVPALFAGNILHYLSDKLNRSLYSIPSALWIDA